MVKGRWWKRSDQRDSLWLNVTDVEVVKLLALVLR